MGKLSLMDNFDIAWKFHRWLLSNKLEATQAFKLADMFLCMLEWKDQSNLQSFRNLCSANKIQVTSEKKEIRFNQSVFPY